jgi:hypothetical protein
VETWVEHPVLGDLHVELFYKDYRDLGGLKVPARISQKQVGMETFVAAITAARKNPEDLAQLMTPPPNAGRGGGPAAAPGAAPTVVASEKLADGVYRITGGYVAMAVELKDSVVVLEGPQSEARGLHHRRNEASVSRQTDQVRREHAPALRSFERPRPVRGRGHHDPHRRQQQVLRRRVARLAADARR